MTDSLASTKRRVNSDSITDLQVTAGSAGGVCVAAAADSACACPTVGRSALPAAQPHERDNPQESGNLFSGTLGHGGGPTGKREPGAYCCHRSGNGKSLGSAATDNPETGSGQ